MTRPRSGIGFNLFSANKRRISSTITTLKSHRLRPWLRAGGLSVLIGGAVWSYSKLGLHLSEISGWLLVLNLLVLSPLLLVLAGISLMVTARVLKLNIPLSKSIETSAMANVAELLPLPGGAFVRGAALVQAGARVKQSARIITLTSILTLSMTLAFSASACGYLGVGPGWWFAALGLVGVIISLHLIARETGRRMLLELLVVRLVMLGLSTFRLAVSFATIGVAASFGQAAVYTVATSLGSAVAVVPAGFGVNELIAAALATLISGSPAAAFLAVALNRTLGLIAGALVTFSVPLFRRVRR